MKASEALRRHRAAIAGIVERHHARNPRVFGSVVHGTDAEGSDIDLLVDTTCETTLMDIGAIRMELKALLGVEVDVLTVRGLPGAFRDRVLAEARPL